MAGKLVVTMPDIGEGVVEGEVVEWLKKPGESVAQDEPVVIVMTDKATVELPSPQKGTFSKHYYQPGEMALRGKPLYEIAVEGMPEPVQEPSQPSKPTLPSRVLPKPRSPLSSGHALAIPSVRRLAHDMGIPIEQVKGSGKDGRVTEEDLRSYSHAGMVPPKESYAGMEDDEIVPYTGVRHLMAKKMKESHDHIPHFSYFEQVDATRLIQLRNKVRGEASQAGIRLTYMPFIIRALSLTMKKFPSINSSLDSAAAHLHLHKHHHIGIAMATEQGLIVPVIRNVETMGLEEIIRAYDALKIKAGEGKLLPAEMKGSTITISNFGVLGGGGLWATPIINYPEAAILAISRIQKQPMVKNGELTARDALNLSWSFDHRIIDGDAAARTSHYFSELLMNPAGLL